MVLQAFIDDSKDDEIFCLGGYVTTADQWVLFSNEWEELLRLKNWPRVKTTDLRHQYRARFSDQINPFIDIIEKYIKYEISFCLEISKLRKVCSEYNMTKRDYNPYYIAWNSIVSSISRAIMQAGDTQGIEFIFDEQAEKSQINKAWDKLIKTASIEDQKFIKNSPIFRSDDDLLPLQAADLAAWHSRKFFKAKNFEIEDGFIYPWRGEPDNLYYAIRTSIDERGMRKTARKAVDTIRFSYPPFSEGATTGPNLRRVKRTRG